ncbi:PilN domain-containing protein [Desulfoluna sp.]|uniref:PilN domain-containing protein n=1 Tax=Desulfoluna sp. TaxID=2045199 RepID=UPI0026378EFD|nr:PilN domain-containing protein [Desulfoluna sp.]
MFPFLEKKILAVETSGETIRAALIVKKGRTHEIRDLVSLVRPSPEDDLPDIGMIKELGVRLGVSEGPAVFVTSMARAVEIPMDGARVYEMKQYELCEAVKWEVEPYTGVTGDNALVGVSVASKAAVEPGMIIPDDDDEETLVNVSVLERNVYRAVKERFKAAGFSLTRIYPPDVCFYMPLYLAPHEEASRAILEIGVDYSNFAILRGGAPLQINTLNISYEALKELLSGESESPDLEETIKFTVGQAPGPLPLVVSGVGAGDPEVVSYLAGVVPHGAEPLEIRKSAGLRGGEAAQNSAFATVSGAGIRELKAGSTRKIGISDEEALVLKVKRSAYLMPLVVMVLLFLVLFSHYEYMRFREGTLKKEMTHYKAVLSEKKATKAHYETLLTRSKKLRDEIDFIKKRIAFAQGDADKKIDHLIRVMEGVADAAPSRVVLTDFTQNGERLYTLSGEAGNLTSVGAYATGLQALAWCEVAEMKEIRQVGASFAFLFSIQTQGASE